MDELTTIVEAQPAKITAFIPWSYAHFFTSKGGREVVLSMTPALNQATATIKVSGKREARQIAARHSAQCWNF